MDEVLENVEENVEENVGQEETEEHDHTGEEETIQDGQLNEQDTEEVEPWLLEDDDTSPKKIPLAAHIRQRDKLKGRLSEKDQELAELKARLEKIEGSKKQQVPPTVRPIIDDYDSIDDYNAAMDAYENSKFEALEQSRNQKRLIEQQKATIDKAVEDHYTRAEKLITENNIDAETYKQTDELVRESVERIYPGRGDQIVDYMISRLGDGSDKVMFALGRNKTFLSEFQSALLNDQSGLQAAILLGERKAMLTRPKTIKSNAPKPAENLSGDKQLGDTSNLKRQYDKAQKNGDSQSAYEAYKAARQAGMDVSKWR